MKKVFFFILATLLIVFSVLAIINIKNFFYAKQQYDICDDGRRECLAESRNSYLFSSVYLDMADSYRDLMDYWSGKMVKEIVMFCLFALLGAGCAVGGGILLSKKIFSRKEEPETVYNAPEENVPDYSDITII